MCQMHELAWAWAETILSQSLDPKFMSWRPRQANLRKKWWANTSTSNDTVDTGRDITFHFAAKSLSGRANNAGVAGNNPYRHVGILPSLDLREIWFCSVKPTQWHSPCCILGLFKALGFLGNSLASRSTRRTGGEFAKIMSLTSSVTAL